MFKIASKYLMQATLLLTEFHPSNAVCFPPPIGRYNTSITTAKLIDHNRLDPYAPTPQPRALMISLFYPVSPASCSPYSTSYMDPITAAFEDAEYAQEGVPAGAVGSLTLQICQDPKPNTHSARPVQMSNPLILFSPGLGNTRLWYSAMAQQCVFIILLSSLTGNISHSSEPHSFACAPLI